MNVKPEFESKVRTSGSKNKNGQPVTLQMTVPKWVRNAYKIQQGDRISVQIQTIQKKQPEPENY